MTPAERMTFVLHDVFRYSFAEFADIVGHTPALRPSRSRVQTTIVSPEDSWAGQGAKPGAGIPALSNRPVPNVSGRRNLRMGWNR
ncbi:hypothetical protein [Nocardia sp. NBC_00403]|uniref:hypothetical protein n=1 Tax=Nocardia sp. NBC_00403 TaxID=2975990 RepID=UPI003FA5E7F4